MINTATERFHPISFRPSPMPSGAAPRYKSLGHHTEGFDTKIEAIDWVKSEERMLLTTREYAWDGEYVPAMIDFFSPIELAKYGQ